MPESNFKTVRSDLHALMQDAQALFAEATAAGGSKADELRARGMSLLDGALDEVQQLQSATLEKSKEIAHSTDTYVRANPWQAVGLAAAGGLLIGMLIARK
jgi:ElaB/YqjD/DUF883 family membrane-anchored ribosome-binding protein